MIDKPTRCIDPVMKYCQGCQYGWVEYPSDVETAQDLEGCCFRSGCMYGLEDTEPTQEEIDEFDAWVKETQETRESEQEEYDDWLNFRRAENEDINK